MPSDLLNEENNNIDEASDLKQSPSTNTNIVSVLTIRKPSREDSRVYVCKASNEFGWAEMKTRLLVKGLCALMTHLYSVCIGVNVNKPFE